MQANQNASASEYRMRLSKGAHLAWILSLFLAVYGASLFAPPLLDDADATHANAARHMVQTGDFVTLYVNGVRYLEKAPLPYWLAAFDFRIFGFNVFSAHLPGALCVLLLSLLAWIWSARAWGERTALYASTAVIACTGVFLFTRTLIPEILLSLLLAATLYFFLQALERQSKKNAYAAWACIGLALLTKGLIAIVFPLGALFFYLFLTRSWGKWRDLRPFTGTLLMLVIAAPWHILAGLRNTGGDHGHGFFWFYFVNEHLLRFLGRRLPHDYNKLPGYLYWSLHLVWLFPWSLFWPAAVLTWWKHRRTSNSFASRSALMLVLFAVLLLVFFSISTNQEYYTFPAYLPLLVLTMVGIVFAEDAYAERGPRRALLGAHIALVIIGVAVAVALASGLWASRSLPYVEDIGSLLAHRGVGDYTLSMSHFFDLTGPSFAALRLPASLAALAFGIGPLIAWRLRVGQKHASATLTIAGTFAVFLIAAHIALIRFGPMLSSHDMETRYEQLISEHRISPQSQLMLYGDQSYGSSIAFYSGKVLPLVEGRSSSMWFGSTFPDAPHIFLTNADLISQWGTGERKVLFVPLERRDAVDALLGSRQILLMEQSGKALITDRPLDDR